MKINATKILWVILLAALIGSAGGFWLRYSNEAANRTVVTAVDYREFSKAANFAERDVQTVLDDLQSAGVENIAIKETTVRDMAERGEIGLYSIAEFSASMKSYRDDIWPRIQPFIQSESTNPSNRIIVSSSPATSAFLKERLEARFTEKELSQFSLAGKDYFLLRTELIPQARTTTSNTDSLPPIFDARLGFDESLLDKLTQQGFHIVLMPGQNRGSNTAYLDEYRQVVDKYDVNILVFDGGQVPGYPDDLDALQGLVEDENLTLGIIETSVQLGYMEQKGIDEIMEAAGYPINRVYSTRNDEFLTDVNERYYRWVRAVVDRGIRVMYVVPFNDQKLSFEQNLDETNAKLAAFHETIASKDFTIGNELPPLSSQIPGPLHWTMVAVSLWLAGCLYLAYLLKLTRKPLYLFIMAGAVLAALVGWKGSVTLAPVYALAAAILYPTLASLIWIIYLRDNREKDGMFKQILISLAILLGVNLLGAYTIISSLADIRYIMNVELFRGVKLAFLAPLMLFVVNYLAVFSGEEGVIRYIAGWLRRSPTYFALFLAFVAVLALYYYVGRSGHTAGVAVSGLELRLREVLETIFLARPRFKEILIGYPALMALVYLYRRYPFRELVLVLGLAVMMGSISTVNSFSHVFTAVTISASRTLAGVLVGVAIGLMVMLALWIADRLWQKWLQPALKE